MRYFLSIIGFIFFISCQQGQNNQENASKDKSAAVVQEEVLSIGKMHCEMCVASIEKGLKNVEGVEFVKVVLEDSTALVKFDASKTNINELINAVEKRGYIVKNNELDY